MALTTDIELAPAAAAPAEASPPVSSNPHEDVRHVTNDSSSGEVEQASLPPTDRGQAAWLVLAGCSIIQAPVWGTQTKIYTTG